MEGTPIPGDADANLTELERSTTLDTDLEKVFDGLTRLAAQICGTPIALVSLVDTNRQWFEATVGIDAQETPCNIAFFAHSNFQSDLLVVPDASLDPRFSGNPLVTGDAHIRFYVGMPLTSRAGHAIGTLCVIDREPKHLMPDQMAALKILSQQIVSQLELRQQTIKLEQILMRENRVEKLGTKLLRAVDHRLEDLAVLNKEGCYTYINPAHAALFPNAIHLHMSGSIHDISERTQTEIKMQEIHLRLQIATESAGIGVWEYKIQSDRLVWDDQMLALYDYSPKDFPGTCEAWSQRLHLEDKTQAERALQESIEGHREFDTEFRLTLPSGAIRHIKAYAQVLKDADGVSTRMIGVNYDITERKQAEGDLQEQALRLRAIVDHAADGIITINEYGVMESFNLAAERLFGYTAAEAIGQNVKMLMPEPYHSEHDGYLANYRRTGHANIIGLGREVLGRRKDGSVLSFELGISEARFGTRRLFIGMIHDITERKQTEFSLLQNAVAMDSHNQQLAEARDQALAATRVKSAFLASMSHEIRTPMNSIIGMADLLQETSLSPDQQEYVHRFSRAATSLLDLINDILDISKIEAGHLELETVPFDLHDLVDKTVELMAVRANVKTLELAAFVHPDVPPWVAGDPTRLRQVFVNLLGNAIKFTEQGQVLLRIEPNPVVPLTLRCSVSDTGIGISEDKRQSIFESFTQVDSSTTRKYGGTGLGLSICKQLVEMMGGTLQVESTLGAGSTFSFEIRLASAPALTPETTPLLAIKGCRILVVDGNATNRLIVQEHLRHFGVRLVEAPHGAAALGALKEAQRRHESFSLAIVDYHMPDMNGLDLVEAIRALPECTTLPIVLYISEIRSATNHRARRLGIASTVYKPISRKRLLTAVAVALGQATAVCDSTESSPTTPTPASLAPFRILLVDDLEDNRDVVRLFLKDTPYQLDMAENGLIAVQKFQAGTYNLVFMDMQMPVMDGFQATATIRQWERAHACRPTPIIAFTANAFQEEIEKSLIVGCTTHVTKPIKKKILLQTILDFATPVLKKAAV